MSTLTKQNKTLLEKVLFAASALLFAALNLVPGLFTGGSYAEAQYSGGGGGGGTCPTGCPGGTIECCSKSTSVCQTKTINGTPTVVCETNTYYYQKK